MLTIEQFFRNSKLRSGMPSSVKVLNYLIVKTAALFFLLFQLKYGQNIFFKNNGALFKEGPSPSKKNVLLFASLKALQKMMKNAFYFIFKRTFCSQDI